MRNRRFSVMLLILFVSLFSLSASEGWFFEAGFEPGVTFQYCNPARSFNFSGEVFLKGGKNWERVGSYLSLEAGFERNLRQGRLFIENDPSYDFTVGIGIQYLKEQFEVLFQVDAVIKNMREKEIDLFSLLGCTAEVRHLFEVNEKVGISLGVPIRALFSKSCFQLTAGLRTGVVIK